MSQKKILVPIDFSDCSIKALEVAIKLAKKINASLIIVNACQKPVAYADATVITYSRSLMREAESGAKAAFENVKESISGLQNVPYDFRVKHSFPQDTIISMALMENIDLIVMGTTGASGFKGTLFGSNTYKVIKNVECPILAVPESAETGKFFKNIVLAGDYENTAAQETFEMLVEIAKSNSSEIHVLHVSDASVMNHEQMEEARRLNSYLKNLKHSFHFKPNKPVDEGINEYIEENGIDMLTLVAKKHSLLERIFKGSMTRKMAYHSKVPLLILHSK